MLSFTHDSRKKTANPYQLQVEEQYHPIVITNNYQKKEKFIEPIRSKKKIIKTHSNNKPKKTMQRTEKSRNKITQIQNKPWNNQGLINNNVGLFDRKLKKDTLAAEQRQIRAKSRTQANAIAKQKYIHGNDEYILNKQQEIHRKKVAILSQEQQKQIQTLKKMIQKERIEKQKNDIQYERKKKQIQQQRRQLIQLQKQLQRQGPKGTKQIQRKMKAMDIQIYPANDKVKLKNPLDQSNPKKAERQPNLNEITQSQSIANQKNRLRQQQLEYLVDQRQKNFKQYKKNTLGYTPTLIPLLSRASYKIISTQISSLVELFIDDLLEEQVYLLQAIQLQQRAEISKRKQKEVINDYVRKLDQFVNETDQIENKVGRYNQMKFQDIYRPIQMVSDADKDNPKFSYNSQLYAKLSLGLSSNQMEEVQHRIDRFKRFVNSFDEYKPANMTMFAQVTEQVINEAIQKLAKELDNGAGEFVNIVFRKEFQ